MQEGEGRGTVAAPQETCLGEDGVDASVGGEAPVGWGAQLETDVRARSALSREAVTWSMPALVGLVAS